MKATLTQKKNNTNLPTCDYSLVVADELPVGMLRACNYVNVYTKYRTRLVNVCTNAVAIKKRRWFDNGIIVMTNSRVT